MPNLDQFLGKDYMNKIGYSNSQKKKNAQQKKLVYEHDKNKRQKVEQDTILAQSFTDINQEQDQIN
jgi:hypothetical protein